MKELLKSKNFVLLWLGQLVSSFGDGVALIAQSLWFINITGSAIMTGGYFATGIIAKVIFMPFAGILVDRLSRRNIIIYGDIVRGILLILLSVIISTKLSIEIKVIIFYLFTFSSNLISLLFRTAVGAEKPNIIKKDLLMQANSLMHSTGYISNVISLAFGAILISTIGYQLCFLIDGISFILSAISEMFIDFPKSKTSGPKKILSVKSFAEDFTAGLKYVKRFDKIKSIIVFFAIFNFFLAPLNAIVFPFMMKNQILRENFTLLFFEFTPESGLVFYQTALSIVASLAGIITGIVKALKGEDTSVTKAISYASIMIGISTILVGVLFNMVVVNALTPLVLFVIFVLILFLRTSMSSVININIGVYFQKNVDNEYRGRVMSFFALISQVSMPLGIAIYSFIITFVSSYNTIYLYNGLIVLISSIILYKNLKKDGDVNPIEHKHVI